MKVAFCAGHGGFGVTPGKRTPDGEFEWNFNNKVALAFEAAMNQYENVQLLRTDDRTGHTDVPLQKRTDSANAWGADIYISFHHDAYKGVWGTHTGTTVYVWTTPGAKALALANAVHPKVLNAYGLRDKGIQKADFHIVRETKMPAILIEGGYMDSTIDIKKLRDDSVLKAAGYGVAEAVAAYGGLKKKAVVVAPVAQVKAYSLDTIPVKGPTMYRMAKLLDSADPKVIDQAKKDGYRVIALPEGN